MRRGEPDDPRLPWVRRLHDLDEARAHKASSARLAGIRRGGLLLGEALREGPEVAALRTLPITTLLYPTAFAFNRAVPLAAPYVVMSHRALLVQAETTHGLKNILWNPTDPIASRATPFFARTIERIGERGADLLTKREAPLEAQLRALGLTPEDIDVVAFDHFHTQDLRSLFGSSEPRPDGSPFPARFPNALLLAPRVEWEDWDDLHPLQEPWFVRDGKRGVPSERVILTEGDLSLGEGALLLQTPGHTTGNQTLFVNTSRGVFGCSENGTSADSWAPYESRIPGLRGYVRLYGAEVVLNSNTPELAAEQYTSMILERSVASRAEDSPAFVQMFPSSEVTPSLLCPGIRPSMIFSAIESGSVRTR